MTENKVEEVKPEDLKITLETDIPEDKLDIQAFRRGKVRELMRMGYSAPQISAVLKAGVRASADGKKIPIPASVPTIQSDMAYIRQEDAATAASVDLPEKRQEVVENLRFVYNTAIREYLTAKGAVKNSFLNTAIVALSKIAELEGLKNEQKVESSVSVETKVSKVADEIRNLDKDARDTIITTVRKVLRGSQLQGSGDPRISADTYGVPASPSDDEGISGES